MKKVLLLASVIILSFITKPVTAQYCGTSNSTICTANANFTTVGFSPVEDSLPCITDGTLYSQVVQVHTPATASQGGSTYPLTSVKVVSITNLPCNMCWAMGNSNLTIAGNATGCLKVSGTTYDAPGQYLLNVIVNATVSVGGFPFTVNNQNLASQGLKYYLRVVLPTEACALVDTLSTGDTAHTVGTLAAPTIAGNSYVCQGSSTALTANGTNIYAYAWSNGSFTKTINVTSAGTYTVTVYGECTTATASKVITLSTVRDTITAGGATTFCQGGSVALSVPAGSTTYHWSTGATTNSITASTTGSYVVTVSNSTGCTATSTAVAVTANPLPGDTITATSFVICPGGSVTLNGPAGMTSYLWSTGATTRSITSSTATNYTLTVTNANNCSAVSAQVSTTIGTLPSATVTAGGATTFCAGGSVSLSGVAGLTYHWSTGATTQSITATTAGSYTLTVTNANGCSAVSSATTVTVNPLPGDTITASSFSICPGSSITLNGPVGMATYLWSTGATTSSITSSTATTYTLTVTNANNCSAVSAQVSTTIGALPSTTITTGGSITFCVGGSVTLSGVAGLTYHWSTGATTQSITATTAGTYTLTVTNGNGCSAVSTGTTVSVNPLPADTITPAGSLAFCPGGNVTLNGPAGLTYLWSNGNTTQSITVSTAGSYTLSVSNNNNCSAVSAPVVTTLNAVPSNTVTPSGSLSFCPGGSVTLTAATGLTYLWSNGSTTGSITVNQAGTYSVTLTNGNNCTATSTPVVTSLYASPNDTVTLSGSATICAGGSVTLSAVAGLTYLWSNGATTQSVTASQTGTYTVSVSNQNNCSAVSSAVTVTVNSLPDSTVTTGGPTTFCAGGSVTLSAVAGLNYVWSNGATTQSISATQATSYTVTVTNNNQCSAVSQATVITFNAATNIGTQPVSQSTCINGQVVFTVAASGTNITYQWQKNGVDINNQTGTTYTIPSVASTDTGNYTVIVSGLCGNDTSNIAALTLSNTLTFSQQPVAQSACIGSSASFTAIANGSNTTFQWYKNGQLVANATSSTYTINAVATTDTGSYSCFVTSNCGNATSDTVRLTINLPSASSYSQVICSGSSYSFGGQNLTTAGTYTDTLTNALGCDSVITLNLSISTAVTYGYSDWVCSGRPYIFNGVSLTTAGVYSDTLTTQGGCDSIVTLTLSIRNPTSSNNSVSICQGQTYSFNGQSITSAGTYQATLTGANGCDSVATVQVTVNQPSASQVSATICSNQVYSFNGQQLSTGGTYNATLTNAMGCDSVITLTLTVNQTAATSFNATICAGSIYNFNGLSLMSAGTYHDTLQTTTGCDSVVTVHLTVNAATGSSVSATVCQGTGYTFGGNTLTASGTYYDTLSNSLGCDSIVTLHLTVSTVITNTTSAQICTGSSFTFNGQVLTATGVYSDTLTTNSGCDSIVTLNLLVSPIIQHQEQATICAGGSYSFNGQQLTTQGTYSDTLTTGSGCDSVVHLHLRVLPALSSNINAAICGGSAYSFNGQSLTTAGTYTDTLTGQGGCDSIVTLNLTITQGFNVTLHESICAGSSYNFNGQFLAISGTYTDTTSTQGGCDSTTTLFLTVIPNPTITWAQPDTICDNNQATQFTLIAPIPAGGVLTGNGLNGLTLTVNGAGTYPVTYTYVAGSGCSNAETKNIVVESCLGLNEVGGEIAISIYPNPANDVVVAQGDALTNLHTAPVVYDVTGKLMTVAYTQQADKLTFNTGHLAAGLYMIKMNINGTTVTKRFVKAD